MQFTFIFSLIFAILIALFAIVNSDAVTVNVLFTKIKTSQAVVILFSAALGAIIVYMMDLVKKLKNSLKVKDLEKRIKGLEQELEKTGNELENFKNENVSLMDENVSLNEELEKANSKINEEKVTEIKEIQENTNE